jgi:single-strand DNA-binding protein
MSINKVILIGRLGMDPEIKFLDNGRCKVTFNLATNESFRNKKGEIETVSDWHHILAWGKIAENMQKLKKGYQVYIEGKIKYNAYEKDGSKHYKTTIQVDIFRTLSKPIKREEDDKNETPFKDDDLPF